MTSHPQAQAGYGQNAPVAPVKRPTVLIVAIGVAVVTALVTIIDGVMMLTGGKELAVDIAAKVVADITGESIEAVKASGGVLLDTGVDEIVSGLNSRGSLALAFGALLLLFGLLMLGASVWSRVLVTLSAVLTALIGVRIATDDVTAVINGLGGVAAALGLVTIVLAWLPANGRYAKARKQVPAPAGL